MGVMSKYKKRKIEWGVNTEGFEYRKPSEMPQNKTILLRGCFITPDRGYGKGAVLITDKDLLSIPERYVGMVSDFLNDEETISAIKAGKVGFIITEFVSETHKRKGYRVDFIDIE